MFWPQDHQNIKFFHLADLIAIFSSRVEKLLKVRHLHLSLSFFIDAKICVEIRDATTSGRRGKMSTQFSFIDARRRRFESLRPKFLDSSWSSAAISRNKSLIFDLGLFQHYSSRDNHQWLQYCKHGDLSMTVNDKIAGSDLERFWIRFAFLTQFIVAHDLQTRLRLLLDLIYLKIHPEGPIL